MNMRFNAGLALMGLLVLALVGCRSNPVYNVTGAPVTTSTRSYALSDVRAAILQAGAAQGWQMKAVRPGLIIGTLEVRDHGQRRLMARRLRNRPASHQIQRNQ